MFEGILTQSTLDSNLNAWNYTEYFTEVYKTWILTHTMNCLEHRNKDIDAG
jgi:hypothetical protein